MLATLGYIVADFVKLPGDVHQVSSLAAHDVAVKSGAMIQILFWYATLLSTDFSSKSCNLYCHICYSRTSLLEIISVPAVAALSKGDRQPGNDL